MYCRGSRLDIPIHPDVSVPLKSDVKPAGAVCGGAEADVVDVDPVVVEEAQAPTRRAPMKTVHRFRDIGNLVKARAGSF
jgi:hypothetical protein